MQRKQDASFGIIPVIQIDDEWQVFLIHQMGRRNDTFWTFPKGHAEPNETPQETATRELFEETGLTPKRIEEDPIFTEQYFFQDGDTEITKTVSYYLGYIENRAATLQASEVHDGGWFTLPLARERISFENKRVFIDELTTLLKERNS